MNRDLSPKRMNETFVVHVFSARDCVKDKYFLHGVEIVKFSVIVSFTTLG